MKEHWTKELVPLRTDEDYYVECAIKDVHLFAQNGMLPRTWTGYLALLDGRLDYFLGKIDE